MALYRQSNDVMVQSSFIRDRRLSRKIMYLQYTNPAAYPPLEHSSRILADSGWQVLFCGTGSLGANNLRFSPHARITIRQLAFSPAGWRQKLHYLQFSLWVLGWTLCWRPAWVYASDLLACPIALLLSALPGVRVIYHEHDSPSSSQSSLFKKLSLWARRKLAHRAEMCVLPNQKRAESFRAELAVSAVNGHQSTAVVWNCPSLKEVSKPRLPHEGGDLWVLYHGSIVPARLPVAALEALALLPERVKLRVIGYETVGHQGYIDLLKERARVLGISDRLDFLGTLPERKTLLSWCRKSDVGLALMPMGSVDINEQAMVGASNKPFDYLSCGLALLVSDLVDWRQMYVNSGCGLACDSADPQSIAAALQWFLDHLVEMRTMGELGRQKVETEWNYENQFYPLLREVGFLNN
jgi:glycosyltransferase involved in cell wall biosynthesis